MQFITIEVHYALSNEPTIMHCPPNGAQQRRMYD